MDKPETRVEDFTYIFEVAGVNRAGFVVELETGSKHRLVVDEPRDFGGSDQGPNPIEVFLSSIAACFAISYRIFAAKRGVDIDRIEVFARGSFDIRSFIGIEGFEPGLSKIELKAKIVAKSRCSEAKEIVDEVLRRWVVGSTVARGTPIHVTYEIVCLET